MFKPPMHQKQSQEKMLNNETTLTAAGLLLTIDLYDARRYLDGALCNSVSLSLTNL